MGFWKWTVKQIRKNNTDYEEEEGPKAKSLPVTEENIKKELKDIDDLVVRHHKLNGENISFIFIKSLVQNNIYQEMILSPLGKIGQKSIKEALGAQNVKDEMAEVVSAILEGSTILLNNSNNKILKVDTFSVPSRSILTSENETTMLGPQDSFIESLNANLSLVRKRIKNPKLKIKIYQIGVETNTQVAICYMEGIANPENVERLRYRIQNVEVKGLADSSVLQQMIEDKPYSPFPQFGLTNRPDSTVDSLLDGRIAVLMDNSPEVIICPTSFFELFSTPEDFYNRYSTASLLRLIRFFGFFITIMLTPAYVSALTYQPEVLPSKLLILLMESRNKVPFPPVIEVLIIEIVIEILREAGSRMPTKIGQTIGIVGGIVIGTAAVDAGLASNILIVLVATSALLSFLPPNYLMSNAARFIRYIFIISAGMFGLFGQFLALAWLLIHLSNLTSLGTPFMTPFIPRKWSDLVDSPIRLPLLYIIRRKGISRAKRPLIRPLDEE